MRLGLGTLMNRTEAKSAQGIVRIPGAYRSQMALRGCRYSLNRYWKNRDHLL